MEETYRFEGAREMPKKNPRRTLIANLRDVKRQIERTVTVWDVRGAVWEPDGKGTSHTVRPRRENEFPENDPRKWVTAAHQARHLAYHLNLLAEFCDRQARAAYQRRELDTASK